MSARTCGQGMNGASDGPMNPILEYGPPVNLIVLLDKGQRAMMRMFTGGYVPDAPPAPAQRPLPGLQAAQHIPEAVELGGQSSGEQQGQSYRMEGVQIKKGERGRYVVKRSVVRGCAPEAASFGNTPVLPPQAAAAVKMRRTRNKAGGTAPKAAALLAQAPQSVGSPSGLVAPPPLPAVSRPLAPPRRLMAPSAQPMAPPPRPMAPPALPMPTRQRLLPQFTPPTTLNAIP
jgi:hypothetical protein